MYVTITLNSPLGADLGPNFNLTADVGSVTPSTATKAELLAGKIVDVNTSATQVTVTSTGACTTSITINISGQTTTTTTAAPAQFTIGYAVGTPFQSCVNRTIDPRIVYAANGASLGNGVALYYDQQLTAPVDTGFYSDGTNWYRVTGGLGIISSNGSCATTTTTTTTGAPTTTTSTSTSTSTTTSGPTSTTTTTQAPATFSLRYSTIGGGHACYQSATTYYAENGSLLQNGTVIYTNGTLTTLAPAGWYSDGTNYWYVSPTCFEYDVTNGGASPVNITFRDCDNTVTLVTIAAGATENVCASQFDDLSGCTTVLKGVGICLTTTDGILTGQTVCPATTTSTSTSTSTSTTSTSTSTSTTSTSTSTSTTLPPTTSTSTSTSTTSTTTGGPTSTTSTTTQPGSTTTSTSTTSTSTTTAAPTTTSTSTSTTSTSTTTAGPGLSVAQGTVTCTNDTGAFTSTASGGSGTYDWIAIASTQANAISYVNGVGGTRYAMSTNPYNWSGIANGTWYIAVKDSSGTTAYGTVVVACSTTSTTSTSTSTTTTIASYCGEYEIQNMTETSIGISYYNCSGTYITDSVGSGQTVTFCANLFYGPISGGSYTLLGACPGTTTTTTAAPTTTSTSTSTTSTTTTAAPTTTSTSTSTTSTTTAAVVTHFRSVTPQNSAANACAQSAPNNIYTPISTSTMAVNDVLYSDSGLTTLFNGNSQWYKIIWKGAVGTDDVYAVQISSTGDVLAWEYCPSTTTTTTTTAAPTTTSTSTTSTSTSTTTTPPLTQVNINLCAGGADGSGYVDVFAYSNIAVDTQISIPFRWTGDLSSVFEGYVLINSGQTCGTVNVLAGQIGENFSDLNFLGDISPMTSLNQEYVPQFAGSGAPCMSC